MRKALFDATLGAGLIVVAAVMALYAWPVRSEFVEPNVDTELVLLSDVSSSMSDTERLLQRQGYVKALTSPATIEAIQTGALGRVAVTYIEHGEATQIRVVAPWAVISDQASAASFAAVIASAEPFEGNMTDIGAGLAFAAAEIDWNAYQGLRRIIDVSGDGEHNKGTAPAPVRDEITGRGITINGLPVGGMGAPKRFEESIIGGPGHVMVPCRDYRGFAEALARKLRLEIS